MFIIFTSPHSNLDFSSSLVHEAAEPTVKSNVSDSEEIKTSEQTNTSE